MLGAPFLPLGFENVDIPPRRSGFALCIGVGLQAHAKQVQLFFLILQLGVKGLTLFGLENLEDHACDRPAFFDHFHPYTEPGPGWIVIDLPDSRFQDIAAQILPPQELAFGHFEPLPQLFYTGSEFRDFLVRNRFQKLVEGDGVLAGELNQEVRTQTGETPGVLENRDEEGREIESQSAPFSYLILRLVVYLYPAGNAVASTSGTIPPFHYLCEGVLPWYHTSFSTS